MKKFFIYAFLMTVATSCGSKSDDSEPLPTPTNEIETFFKTEVKPAASLPCFQGAYYRKVVSSNDYWLGINGEVSLPTIQFDEDRKNPNKAQQYLDNPSIYMGGNMDGQETDIGLTWEVIRDENGVVSQDRRAFRPFMRRTGHKSGQAALYANAPAQAEYYWYPGDKINMSIEVIENGKVKFIVEGAGKKFETIFECAGYTLTRQGEFKRVNAIDQVSNEGKPAQLSKTSVSGSKWFKTNLVRYQNGKRVHAPMHNERFTSMLCPAVKHFAITQTADEKKIGAEAININAGGF
ncbi:hypothetical protein [Sphingobacterium bovistauri]|uniref:Methane oxygenase PmoA n=1 Tax=Sphingobacterium bovistauri TaxID=2781959 RepID=A0ABS7Z493_9SPHI|nr:hypothetical protein [Sphingobacterium bovistauri]MCA5004382.1 hypothetical protein [Sphingobacterium bovistauri]